MKSQSAKKMWFRLTFGNSDGGALVEIAVTLPIILLIMTGIFSFSVALHQKLQLSEAVSNGGRTIAIERGDSNPCLTTANAIYSAAPGLDPSKMTLKISFGTTSNNAGSCSGATMTAGDNATVYAEYPCSLGVYGVNFAACTLRTEINEVIQ